MALPRTKIKKVFGDPFGGAPIVKNSDGHIRVAERWFRESLIRVTFPFASGKTFTGFAHRLVAPFLQAAFADLGAVGLLSLVHTIDGCYVPRVVRGKVSASKHTWGIALDLNAGLFPIGSTGKQDARLTGIFKRHGFLCAERGGGLWTKPRHWDPMHFEFVDLSLLERGAAEGIRIVFAGMDKEIRGLLQGGRVLGSVRDIAEALGASVRWDSETRTVHVKAGQKGRRR